MPTYSSPLPPVSDIPQISLFSYLLPTNDDHPERAAFIDAPTGRVLTRGQLQHDARALAYGLRLGLERHGGLNVPRRSTILIFSGNSISVPLGILATLAAGLCISMASSSLTPPELAYQIKDSEPTHLLVQPELVPIAITALESFGVQPEDMKRRILLLAPASGVPKDIRGRNLLNLDDIMADNKQLFPEAYDGEHSQRTAMLFYSSGTTGAHLNYNFIFISRYSLKLRGFRSTKRCRTNTLQLGGDVLPVAGHASLRPSPWRGPKWRCCPRCHATLPCLRWHYAHFSPTRTQ